MGAPRTSEQRCEIHHWPRGGSAFQQKSSHVSAVFRMGAFACWAAAQPSATLSGSIATESMETFVRSSQSLCGRSGLVLTRPGWIAEVQLVRTSARGSRLSISMHPPGGTYASRG